MSDKNLGDKDMAEKEQQAAVEDSFPASDPQSPTSGVGRRDKESAARADGDDAQPKGHPSADRHEQETTAGRVGGHPVPHHKAQ